MADINKKLVTAGNLKTVAEALVGKVNDAKQDALDAAAAVAADLESLNGTVASNKSTLEGKITQVEKDYGVASVIGIFVFIVVATFSLITYSRSNAVKNEGDFQ